MANGFDHLVGNFFAVILMSIFYAIYRAIKSLYINKIVIKKVQIDIDGEPITLDDYNEHEVCGYNFYVSKKGKVVELRTSTLLSIKDVLRLIHRLRHNGIVLLYHIKEDESEDCIAYYLNGKVRLMSKNITLIFSQDNMPVEKDAPLLRGMIVKKDDEQYIVSRDLGEYRLECIKKEKGTDYNHAKVYSANAFEKTFDWAINMEVTPELLNEWGLKLDDNGIVVFNE